jgi:beta-cyclopiazonate dehydrogenase
VIGIPIYTADEVAAAFGRYAALIQPYVTFVAPAYNLIPDPVPGDLYRPFGDFIKPYGLEPAVSKIWGFTSTFGDLLETPLLAVMSVFGLPELAALQQAPSFLVPSRHSNSEL